MRNEKLLRSIGNIADKFVKEAAPQHDMPDGRKTNPKKRRFLRFMPIAASFVIGLLVTTVFAASYVQSSLGEFYLRYLSTEEMAVSDSIAEHLGVKIYFDGLKTEDWYKQYFAINKLVEYYNDEAVRRDSIRAIAPFLASENEKIADAATFALSVLTQTFDDPRIIHLADGSLVFTLFNDYSDYGSYNQLWQIKDGELNKYFDRLAEPHMYIRQIIPSPDAKLFAVYTISNKSGYVAVHDTINGYVSSELIDSARILAAKDMGYAIRQRIDFENYSGVAESWNNDTGKYDRSIRWIDNTTLEFEASLSGDVEEPDGLSYGGFSVNAVVRYNSEKMSIEYGTLSE